MPALPTTLTRWVVVSAAMLGCSSAPSNTADGGDASDGGASDGDRDGSPDDSSLDDAGVDAMDSMIDAPPAGTLAAMCGTTPTTPTQWEQCYVKRWCEATVNCSPLTMYANVQECVDTSGWSTGGQRDFDTAENIRAVSDGRATIDVTEFTQCLVDLGAIHCNTAGTAASCKLRYDGAVANAQPCYADAECAAPGAVCTPTDCGAACCTGTCARKKMLGEGACTGSGVNACEPGLVCSASQGGCYGGDPGDVCARSSDCDARAFCDQIGTQPGICAADKGAGATCKGVLECGEETGCVGLRRNVGTPMCRRLTEPGDACDDYCLGAMYCDLSNPTGLGVCRNLPTGEEPCNSLLPCAGVHQQCGATNHCELRIQNGQSCSNPDLVCDVGMFCTSALGMPGPTCRPQFADGESGCLQDYQCTSHLCSGSFSSPGQCLPGLSTCP